MKDEKTIITEEADQKESKFGFERLEKAEISQELKEQAEGKYRNLSGFPRKLAFVIAVATTLIVFYTAFAGVFLPMVERSIIISSMLSLTFL